MAIRILIIGTGGMARAHAGAFAQMEGVEVVAGVDTDRGRLDGFCDAHGIANRFSSVAEALAWGDFDAASNVTPDKAHYPTTMPLVAAGKHVLCEKPLATNHADALAMADAASAAGVVNMVNLTYRNVAALQKARQMVAAGEIGEIRHFDASYLQSWLLQSAWGAWDKEPGWLWRLSTAHGSMGTLGDIGIHILDFASFIAGLDVAEVGCRLTTFDKAPGGRIGEYVLDANDSFAMNVSLSNGALGVVHASRFAAGHLNDLTLRIHGTRGALLVENAGSHGRLQALTGDLAAPSWQDVPLGDVPTNYANFIAAIRGEGPGLPDFARGAALQKVLDLAARSDAEGGRVLAV